MRKSQDYYETAAKAAMDSWSEILRGFQKNKAALPNDVAIAAQTLQAAQVYATLAVAAATIEVAGGSVS